MKKIGLTLAICFLYAATVHANSSETGDFEVEGQTIIRGTMTVGGNAFSVGGSTFVVDGGNVGIGTTGPNGILHVSTGTASETANLFISATDGFIGVGTTNPVTELHMLLDSVAIRLEDDGGSIIQMSAENTATFINTVSNHPMHLATNNTTRLTIEAGGDIGVGTTNPVTELHMLLDSVAIRLEDDGGSIIQTSAENTATFINTVSNHPMHLATNNTTRLTIEAGGNIHINPTGSADVELEVSDGTGDPGGGTIHRFSSGAHSSREIKSDIVYLPVSSTRDQAWKDIKSLKPASFRFLVHKSTSSDELIRNPNGKIHKGLIFEDSPLSIRGEHEDIIIDKRILNLEMALQEAIRRIEALQSRVDVLENQ